MRILGFGGLIILTKKKWRRRGAHLTIDPRQAQAGGKRRSWRVEVKTHRLPISLGQRNDAFRRADNAGRSFGPGIGQTDTRRLSDGLRRFVNQRR
jgi:hypothetical protein